MSLNQNNVVNELVLVSKASVGSRKRQKTVPKRQLLKDKRYAAPSGGCVFVGCTHKGTVFKCNKVRPRDAVTFRKTLYSKPEKIYQDQLVGRFITTKTVHRRRSRQSCLGLGLPQPKTKPKSTSVTYRFPLASGGSVTVCKAFFLRLMQFTPERVRCIISKLKTNKGLEDNRGGDRVSQRSFAKKEAVRQFIGNLKGTESHYNRKKSKRIYLSSDLSIRKLHQIYNASEENPTLHVKISMFRKIFCGEFNIGFRSPASDICGYCAMMDYKIKNASVAQKQVLFTEKRIHKKRAKCFYDLMKETKEGEKTLCFDMQQVQPLPRTPIQQAFYARQLGLYNVCVTDVKTNQQPCFYIWTEEQAGRGSTEVASALLAYLKSDDLSQVTHLRLFCDGCTGQNKNNHVVHTLMYFLASHVGSLKNITITFPVRGHSFLPADRVFGRAEKLLRKKPTLITKEEYFEEYKKVGTVKILGTDWSLKDVKSLDKSLKHLPKISDTKRIFIYKVVKKNKVQIWVKGNEFYRFEPNLIEYSLLKKHMNWAKILETPLEDIPLVHFVSAAKKKDVNELLTILFEQNWQENVSLQWYKDIIVDTPSSPEEEEEVVECDCLEEDCAHHL
jgi:hypothetical protein